MDKADVHAHLFKVNASEQTERSMESLINVINQDELESRIRGAGTAEVRLDAIVKKKLKDGTRLWYLDFTRFRDRYGPGKTKRHSAVADIPMEQDEFFGEEAAALYLPDYDYILVQYNHFGVRPSSMETYFSNYLMNEVNVYSFSVTLDMEADQRFRRQNQIRRFEIGVDLNKMSRADRQAGSSLGEIVQAGVDMEGARMKIILSVGRQRAGLSGGVKAAIENLVLGNDAITTAQVTGRETASGETETVDLIEQKLVHVDEITPNDSRRLAKEDRFKLLKRAHTKWRQRIEG